MAAETVDTRVVEAKFDSKQFEQGVDKTVKKLDELKKSLNLKDGEKSVAEIGNKISETSEKASNSLEKLQERFTSFTGMLKQKLISGIADEIVGSVFKIKNAIGSLIQQLSTGQIGYGMQRYTDILTSVRTLTAAGVTESAAYSTIERLGQYADQTSYSLDQLVSTMSKFKTAGADLGTAQRMVEGLSNAAASMGVNAQDAVRAYLNLQQAYSKGRMTQADWISFESLPMVGEKFNQAIIDAAVKVGTLKKDKKGGTYKIDAKAIKAGGNTGGVRMSGAATKGITAQNMGTKLASGWFDKRVMEEVFGNTYYFAEVGIDEVNEYKAKQRELKAKLKAAGYKEEEIQERSQEELQKYFDEINEEKLSEKKAEIEERKAAAKAKLDAENQNSKNYEDAKKEYDKTIKELDKELKDFEANNHLSAVAFDFFQAGQEARSFNDVLNTLKDTISRGWATSFELIFGKLDEAKDFFTQLTESQLAEGIYKIGEFRNLVLQGWRDTGGRDSLLNLLEQIDNMFGSIWKKMGLMVDEERWFEEHFDQQMYNQILKQEGKDQAEAYKQSIKDNASDQYQNSLEKTAKNIGLRISILTRNISDFFEKVHKWFTEADSTGTSRLQRISHILEGFGTIGQGALFAVGQGLEFIGKVYSTFKTSFDALWRAIDNISQKVFAVFNPNIKTDGFNVFTALEDTFNNILTVLEPLNKPLTDLIGILENVVGFFVDIGIGTALANMQFFTDGLGLLLEVLFGSSSQMDRDLKTKGIDDLNKQLKDGVITEEQYNEKLKELKKSSGVWGGIVSDLTELGDAFKSAGTAISEFFTSLFNDLRILVGLKEDENGEKHGIFANIENWFNTNEFVQKVKDKVNKAITDVGDFIKDLPNRIVDIGINIGDFFKSIFFEKKLVVTYGPKGQTSAYQWIKKPLTEWIENAANTVWSFVTVEIPKYVSNLPSIVESFFNNLFYEKKEAKKNDQGFYEYTETRTPLKIWLDQAILDTKNFINDIPNQLLKIPSIISTFFEGIFFTKKVSQVTSTGTIYSYTPTALKKWLDQAVSDVWKFITVDIPKFVSKIPSLIGKFLDYLFGDKIVYKYKNGRLQSTRVKGVLKDWLDGVIAEAKKFIKNLPNNIKNIGITIGDLLKSIFFEKKVVSTYGPNGQTSAYQWVQRPITKWIDENVIGGLREFVQNLPDHIGQAIGTVSNFVGKVVSAIFGKEDGAEVTSEDVTEGIRKPFLGVNTTGIINSIKGVAKRILNGVASAFTGQTDWESNKNWLAEGVGNLIKNIQTKAEEVWNEIQKFFEDLPDRITEFFSGSAKETEKDGTIWKEAEKVVLGISEWIKTVPTTLSNAWKASEALVDGLWTTIIGWITGKSKNDDTLNAFNQNIYDSMIHNGSFDTAEMFKETALKEQWREDNPIAANMEEFFNNLIDFLAERILEIPANIEKTWGDLCTIAKAISDVLTNKVDPKLQDTDPVYSIATSIFGSIADWFTTHKDELITKIKSGWDKAVTIGSIIADVLFGDGKSVFDPDQYNKYLGPKGLGTAAAEAYRQGTKDHGVYNSIALFFTNVRDWIRSQITNLPGNIMKGWTALKTLGEEYGPVILDGLQKGLEWVEKGFEGLTSWFEKQNKIPESEKKPLIESLDDYFTDDKGNINPLWKKVKSVGETLKNLIIITIPQFISEAVQTIVKDAPSLLGGLFNIDELTNGLFGGKKESKKESEKELEKEVNEQEERTEKHLKKYLDTGFSDPMVKLIENFRRTFSKENPIKELFHSNDSALSFEEYLESIGFSYDSNKGDPNKKISFLDFKESGFLNFEEYAKSMGWSYNPNKKSGLFGALADDADESTAAVKTIARDQERIIELQKKIEEAKAEMKLWPSYSEGHAKIQKEIETYEKMLSDLTGENTEKKSTESTVGLDQASKEVEEATKKAKDTVEESKEVAEEAKDEELDEYEQEMARRLQILELETKIADAEQHLIDYDKDSSDYKNLQEKIEEYTKTLEKLKSAGEESQETTEETKDYQSFEETALGFVGSFSNLINSLGDFATSDTGKAILHIIAVTYLLDKIKDMLSLSDDLSDIAEAVKGVIISTVFAGLTALLGYVIYLATLDPNSDTMKKIEHLFDCLAEIAKWIAIFAIAWKAGGSIKDLIGLFKDGGIGEGLGKGAAKAAGEQMAETTGIASVMEFLTSLKDTVAKPLVISGVGEAIVSVVEKVGMSLGEIGVSIGQAIDTLMEYVTPSIEKVNSVSGQLSEALESIPLLRSFIEEFLGAFVYEDWRIITSQDTKLTGADDHFINENFIEENMKIIDTVTMIITHMANGLKAFDDLGSVDDVKQKITDLTTVISSFEFSNLYTELFDAVFTAFLPAVGTEEDNSTLLPRLANLGTIVRLVADALSIFGTSVNGISLDSIGAINTVFGFIDTLTNNIDKYVGVPSQGKLWTDFLFGDTSFGAFGRQINTFATNMVSTFRSINSIRQIIDYNSDGFINGLDEYASFSSTIDLINSFAQKMTQLRFENLSSILADDDKVNKLDQNLPVLGHAIMETMFAMNNIKGLETIDFEALGKGIGVFNDIASLAGYYPYQIDFLPSNILKIVDAIVGEDNKSGLVGRLKQAGVGWGREAFGGISEFIEMLGQFSSAVQVFYEKNDTGKYLYEEGLGNIATEMLNILGENNENPDWNMPKITPVLELGEFEESAKKMWSMLGISPGDDWSAFTPSLAVNISGLDLPQLTSIDEKLNVLTEMNNTITQINTAAGNFSSDLRSVTFTIDGAVLTHRIAPLVDAWLGQNVPIIVRTNFNNGGNSGGT